MKYTYNSTKTAVIIKDIYGLGLRLDLSPITLVLGIIIIPVFYTKKHKHFDTAMIS